MFKISEILEFIPKKLFVTLLVILLLEIILPIGLNKFTSYNQNKINEVNEKIKNFSTEYYNFSQQEKYQAILQFLTIDSLLSNKKYLTKIINNLPKYLPKNFSISEFGFDVQTNKIVLSGSLPNWLEYAKVSQYFKQNNNIFPDFKIESLQFDKEKYLINLTISFSVNYQELYK